MGMQGNSRLCQGLIWVWWTDTGREGSSMAGCSTEAIGSCKWADVPVDSGQV